MRRKSFGVGCFKPLIFWGNKIIKLIVIIVVIDNLVVIIDIVIVIVIDGLSSKYEYDSRLILVLVINDDVDAIISIVTIEFKQPIIKSDSNVTIHLKSKSKSWCIKYI